MKIATVETVEVCHQLSRPVGPASVFNTARRSVYVRIATDDGLVGWGETYALAGVHAAIRDTLAPLLIGQDPLDIRRLWSAMWGATFENGFAVGGVDIALHDLWGKALGVPIHRLYGGALRTSVQAYASSGYIRDLDPAVQWPAEAEEVQQRGFRALKLKIGRFDPAYEMELLGKLRASLPTDFKLMVDAWGSYTLPVALQVGRELERMNVYWYEEPLPQSGYVGYEALAAELDIPVAGGELLRSRHAFKELFDRRAVDVVQPDVSICGGITEYLFVAEMARMYGIQCVPHTWNGAIMAVATLHAAAVQPDPARMPGVGAPLLEWDTTENPFMVETLLTPLVLRDGAFDVPQGPGLGVEVDESWLRHHAVGG